MEQLSENQKSQRRTYIIIFLAYIVLSIVLHVSKQEMQNPEYILYFFSGAIAIALGLSIYKKGRNAFQSIALIIGSCITIAFLSSYWFIDLIKYVFNF